MSCCSDYSLLGPVKINDPASIRRVMGALQYHMVHVIINPDVPELVNLEEEERKVVEELMLHMHTNHHKTLLPEACLRFVYAKPMADCVVVAAAEELVSLGPSTIFSADRPDLQDRYKEAEFHFREKVGFDVFKVAKRLPELAPGAFLFFSIVTAKAAVVEELLEKNGGEVRDLQMRIMSRFIRGGVNRANYPDMFQEEMNAILHSGVPRYRAGNTTAAVVGTENRERIGATFHGGVSPENDVESNFDRPLNKLPIRAKQTAMGEKRMTTHEDAFATGSPAPAFATKKEKHGAEFGKKATEVAGGLTEVKASVGKPIKKKSGAATSMTAKMKNAQNMRTGNGTKIRLSDGVLHEELRRSKRTKMAKDAFGN